jgi:hypothetical protein
MARPAGFRNVEFDRGFFDSELQSKTLALVRTKGLQLPSVYNRHCGCDAARVQLSGAPSILQIPNDTRVNESAPEPRAPFCPK